MRTPEEIKAYKRKLYHKNKEHYLEKNKKWRLKNKDKIEMKKEKYRLEVLKNRRTNHKRYALKKIYGITLEKYEQMFKEQEGKCAICGIHQDTLKRSLCVDHNHTTNKVRELLCKKCNTALAYYESYDMKPFFKYLNKHKEKLN